MKVLLSLFSLILFVSAINPVPQSGWKVLDLPTALKNPTIEAMTKFGLEKFMATAFEEQRIETDLILMSYVQVVATRVVPNILIRANEDGTEVYGEVNVVKFNADVVDIHGTVYDVDIVVYHIPDRETFSFLSYVLN